MADEWVGVVRAAAPKYIKGAIDLTIRKRIILALLEARGLIVTNYLGSFEEDFTLDYKEAPVEALGDGGVAEYSRRDYLKHGKRDWRGYLATDLMTLKEKEMLKGGDYVIVNRYKRILPKLVQGVRNQIGLEFYIDGNAAGNENRFCGLETFCGADTGSMTAADLIAPPSDTYCGISTALHQGGSWSADMTTKPCAAVGYDWPEGQGTTEFDYNSPKLINWSGNRWSGTTTTDWKTNSEFCLRRLIQWLSLTAGVESSTLLCVLAGHMLSEFKDAMSSKSRILLPHKESEDLGFGDVLNFEGLALKSEFGIAANTGYAVNVDTTELDVLPSDLIKALDPMFDPNSLSWKFGVYTFGNFKFLPKACAKLKNFK